VKSFPFFLISKLENFVSLLYFFGFVSFSGRQESFKPVLVIPNETIKRIVFGYANTILETAFDFSFNVYKYEKMLDDMALKGEFKPLFEFIAQAIKKNTGIRDYINTQNNEQSVKFMYLKDFCIYDTYIVKSEPEANKGYADLLLMPFNMKYHNIKYGYLIEFKYIKKGTKKKELPTILQSMVAEAKEQIQQYSFDEHIAKTMGLPPFGEVILKKVIIVFHAWDLAYCEEEC
jgi:hypothetical protein